MVAGGDGDDGVASLGGDLRSLGDLGRHEKPRELVSLVVESVVDAIAARGLAEVEGLEVNLVLLALSLEGGEETVLARGKSRVALGVGEAALCAVVVLVELYNILQRLDVGVVELGQIGIDVVVEVDLDIGVLGLVRETAGGAPVPVPAVGADDGLVVCDLSTIDDSSASSLDKIDELEKLVQLILVSVDPEALPGETEGGILESILVGEKLRVTARRGLALLSESVVVARINSIDGVEHKSGILDGARKGSNRVLVLRFGNDAGTGSQANGRLDADESVAHSRVDD